MSVKVLLVPAKGIEPLSRAYESLVLTIELRRHSAVRYIYFTLNC